MAKDEEIEWRRMRRLNHEAGLLYRPKGIIRYLKSSKRILNTVRGSSPSRIRRRLKAEIISSLVKIFK